MREMNDAESRRQQAESNVRAGLVHQETDECEYHPVKLPRRLTATPLQKFEGEFSHSAVRAATSAGDADAVVRWDSCRLDFFAYFFHQGKKYEEKTYDEVRGELPNEAKYKIWTNIAAEFAGKRFFDLIFSMDDLIGGKVHFGGTSDWNATCEVGSGRETEVFTKPTH
jgi:hypothetical protein